MTASNSASRIELHSDSVGTAAAGLGGMGGTAAPIPLNAAEFGLPVPLDVTVIAPDRDPTAVGVKVTLIAHVMPGASEAGQSCVCAKSPDATMLAMPSAAPPLFCSVMT